MTMRIHNLLANMTLRVRLLLAFIGIVLLVGGLSALMGVGLLYRTLPHVQDVLAVDLGAAREIYRQYGAHIADAGRLMARRRNIRENLQRGDLDSLITPLQAIRQSEDLDILMLTDVRGDLLLPLKNRGQRIAVPGLATIVRRPCASGRKSPRRWCSRRPSWPRRARNLRSGHGSRWFRLRIRP